MSEKLADQTPVVPHLAAEFLAWLWWTIDLQESKFELDEVGRVEVWVDQRLSFRRPEDTKVSVVLTGENPASGLEAKAALEDHKVVHELRLGIRRDEREYTVSLRGPGLDITGAKLPQVTAENMEAEVYDRMFLYEELDHILKALYGSFAALRTSKDWDQVVVPALRDWQGPSGGDMVPAFE
jgi:hypothetical protein